jgi:hypothetical protein
MGQAETDLLDHHARHEGGADAMTVDAAAATGSLRTLGTAATAACAGNDARLSNARTPSAHKDSHDPNDGSDPLDTAAPANIDGVQAAAIGTAHTFARADHAHRIQHAIADNAILTVDQADAAAGEYTRLTANGIESRSKSEALADLDLEAADINALALAQAKGVWKHIAPTIMAPAAGDKVRIFFDVAVTIKQVNDCIEGGTNVVWNLYHAAAANEGSPSKLWTADRTTTSASGAETSTFDDATIPAGRWAWFVIISVSGTVTSFSPTAWYTED